jgi:hypothetical protein
VAGTPSRPPEAQQLIERNRATITKIADQLSMGAYSASKQPVPEPRAQGLIIHVLDRSRSTDTPVPYVRISPNDRIVLADQVSGRQLEFLGQIRRHSEGRRFALAIKANGFFSELTGEVAAKLVPLDGKELSVEYGEEALAAEIGRLLGLA